MSSTKAVIDNKSRDEYEIKEDIRALKRVMRFIKNPTHLKEVKDFISSEKVTSEDVDNLANALGAN